MEPFPEVEHCMTGQDIEEDEEDCARAIKVVYDAKTVKYLFKKCFKQDNRKNVWLCQQLILKAGRWVRQEDVVVKYGVRRIIEKEVKALSFLSSPGHPNIVPLLHSFMCGDDIKTVYMVIPYYPGGDLLDMLNNCINKKSILTNQELTTLLRCILSAVEYCHKLGVSHMDITAEQIWFDADGMPVLGDFDTAVRVSPWLPSSNNKPQLIFSEMCGKVSYMPPEMIRLQHLDPFAVDIFSLGCTLYVAATRTFFLNQVKNNTDVQQLIARNRYQILVSDPDGSSELVRKAKIPSSLKDMIARMTRCDPQRRISIEGIKNHRWLHEEIFQQAE